MCCVIGNLWVSILGTKYKSMSLMFTSLVLSTCVVLVLLPNMSNPSFQSWCHICIYIYWCSPNPLSVLHTHQRIILLLRLVSCISCQVHAVINSYRAEFVTVFFAGMHNFDYKCLVASCMGILMGIASSCGAGLPFTLALICCRWTAVGMLVLRYTFKIPHITLPLGNQPVQQAGMVHDDSGICK